GSVAGEGKLPWSFTPSAARVEVCGVAQLSPQFTRLFRVARWHYHFQYRIQIARALLARQPLALDAQALTALAIGRNIQVNAPGQYRHFAPRTQRRFPGRQGHRDQQIMALYVEQRVRHQTDEQVQIPVRCTAAAQAALSLEANALAISDTGGNLHVEAL